MTLDLIIINSFILRQGFIWDLVRSKNENFEWMELTKRSLFHAILHGAEYYSQANEGPWINLSIACIRYFNLGSSKSQDFY